MMLFYIAGIKATKEDLFPPPPAPSCEFVSNASTSVKALVCDTVSNCHKREGERERERDRERERERENKALVILMQNHLKQ